MPYLFHTKVTILYKRRYSSSKVTKAVMVAQLPIYHDELQVSVIEMLHVFIPFVFHYNSIKDFLYKRVCYKMFNYL